MDRYIGASVVQMTVLYAGLVVVAGSANAQQSSSATPAKSAAYPYVLSVPAVRPGDGNFPRVGGSFRCPLLRYRRGAATKATKVKGVLRFGDGANTSMVVASDTALTAAASVGSWTWKQWCSPAVDLLFAYLRGEKTFEIALFDAGAISEESQKTGREIPESARVSEWLKVIGYFY